MNHFFGVIFIVVLIVINQFGYMPKKAIPVTNPEQAATEVLMPACKEPIMTHKQAELCFDQASFIQNRLATEMEVFQKEYLHNGDNWVNPFDDKGERRPDFYGRIQYNFHSYITSPKLVDVNLEILKNAGIPEALFK